MAELLPKSPVLHKKDGAKSRVTTLFTNSSHCLPQQVHQKSDILRHDNVCLIRHSLLGTNNNSVGCAAPGCIRPPAETRASHQPAAFCHHVHLVTSSLQSLYNMKHILAYTSSFVKSRLHIDQPQILHRSFFNDSSCKSINIRFAFPTSPASVCQMSNSGKPGIPIGTSSLRNSILLSVTFFARHMKRRHACIVCQFSDYFRTYPGSCKNLNLPGSFPHKFF